jgi:TRAP-type mannitol/chloroaromatic compound transport system substrate-binding protein
MKGKGKMRTWWLESSENNELVNNAALEKLDEEVRELLTKTNFDTKAQGSEKDVAKKRESLMKRSRS